LDEELSTGRIIRAKDQARYAQKATKEKIKVEGLANSIEGFGSAR